MTLIQQIKQLCIAGQYDEAIAMTNKIDDREFAFRAHLLCIEHELSVLNQKKAGNHDHNQF